MAQKFHYTNSKGSWSMRTALRRCLGRMKMSSSHRPRLPRSCGRTMQTRPVGCPRDRSVLPRPGVTRTAHPSGSPSWPTPGASNAYWARPRIKSSSVPTSSMVAGRIVNTVWKRNLQQIVVLNLSTRRDSTSGAVERIPHVRVPLPRAYAYAGERNCRSRFL